MITEIQNLIKILGAPHTTLCFDKCFYFEDQFIDSIEVTEDGFNLIIFNDSYEYIIDGKTIDEKGLKRIHSELKKLVEN